MDSRIDPMRGVVNPESLVDALRKLKAGDSEAKSYIRGSLQVLERRPPNKFVVPMLRKALEKYT
jgi:hypothetical protein